MYPPACAVVPATSSLTRRASCWFAPSVIVLDLGEPPPASYTSIVTLAMPFPAAKANPVNRPLPLATCGNTNSIAAGRAPIVTSPVSFSISRTPTIEEPSVAAAAVTAPTTTSPTWLVIGIRAEVFAGRDCIEYSPGKVTRTCALPPIFANVSVDAYPPLQLLVETRACPVHPLPVQLH